MGVSVVGCDGERCKLVVYIETVLIHSICSETVTHVMFTLMDSRHYFKKDLWHWVKALMFKACEINYVYLKTLEFSFSLGKI